VPQLVAFFSRRRPVVHTASHACRTPVIWRDVGSNRSSFSATSRADLGAAWWSQKIDGWSGGRSPRRHERAAVARRGPRYATHRWFAVGRLRGALDGGGRAYFGRGLRRCHHSTSYGLCGRGSDRAGQSGPAVMGAISTTALVLDSMPPFAAVPCGRLTAEDAAGVWTMQINAGPTARAAARKRRGRWVINRQRAAGKRCQFLQRPRRWVAGPAVRAAVKEQRFNFRGPRFGLKRRTSPKRQMESACDSIYLTIT